MNTLGFILGAFYLAWLVFTIWLAFYMFQEKAKPYENLPGWGPASYWEPPWKNGRPNPDYRGNGWDGC